MTDEQKALSRRAVACRGWRWMAGMRTTEGMRVIHDPRLWPDRPCAIREGTWVDTAVPRPLGDHLPDLQDPATLGCLLALLREAWGDHATSFANKYEKPTWVWCVYDGRVSSDDYGHEIAKGSTEADALVRALEAAP